MKTAKLRVRYPVTLDEILSFVAKTCSVSKEELVGRGRAFAPARRLAALVASRYYPNVTVAERMGHDQPVICRWVKRAEKEIETDEVARLIFDEAIQWIETREKQIGSAVRNLVVTARRGEVLIPVDGVACQRSESSDT